MIVFFAHEKVYDKMTSVVCVLVCRSCSTLWPILQRDQLNKGDFRLLSVFPETLQEPIVCFDVRPGGVDPFQKRVCFLGGGGEGSELNC